jgi:hypothetical protein
MLRTHNHYHIPVISTLLTPIRRTVKPSLLAHRNTKERRVITVGWYSHSAQLLDQHSHSQTPLLRLRCHKIPAEINIDPISLKQRKLESAHQARKRDIDLAICHRHAKTHAVAAAKCNHVARQLFNAVGALRIPEPALGLIRVAVREDGLIVVHVEIIHGDGEASGDGPVLVREAELIGDTRGALHDTVAEAEGWRGKLVVDIRISSDGLCFSVECNLPSSMHAVR